MTRPRLLDLFCKAGGAAKGYADAGFEVFGVDIQPQPRYPYAFLQVDVLKLDERFVRMFDAVHASPPCQFGTMLRHAPGARTDHVNLIPQTRSLCERAGLPYVIENVDAPDVRPHLRDPILLCGSMFGLGTSGYQLRRHRLFETNWRLKAPACKHTDEPVIGIYGGHVRCRSAKHGGRRTRDFEGFDKPALARVAMGAHWMTMNELSEAIPPAYTQWIGERLIRHLQRRAAA